MVYGEFDDIRLRNIEKMFGFADIIPVGIFKPAEHSAVGIFCETVIGCGNEAVTMRHFVMYHFTHALPHIFRHGVNL